MKQQREGGFLIAKIHHTSGRIFAKILKEHGIDQINPSQGRILFVLWRKDEIPINELAEKTQLSKSALTSMLDRLEKAGHITRVRSKEDRRAIVIKLTEKDRSLQKAYARVSEEMTSIFYGGFSDQEITEFENCLKQILANLTRLSITDRDISIA